MKNKIKIGQKVSVYPKFNTHHTVIGFKKKQAKGYTYFAVKLSDGKTYAPHRIVV